MIRKLASGKYRSIRARRIRRPAGGAISVPLPAAPPRRSTSAPFNCSSGGDLLPLPAVRGDFIPLPPTAVRRTASLRSPMRSAWWGGRRRPTAAVLNSNDADAKHRQ